MPESSNVVTTPGHNVTILDDPLQVGHIAPRHIAAAAFPLLKAMLSAPGERAGFLNYTLDADGLTLIMDARGQQAFEEGAYPVEWSGLEWYAFEIHLGALAWEQPGVVSFLSTIMAENRISILNLLTCDRDFLLVSASDVQRATELIQRSRWAVPQI